MADYKRTELKRFPAISARKSSEYRYWKKFKNPILVKEYAAVNAIHFSPVSPYEFAVTSSTRVQIYSSKSNTVTKTISRFRDTAYSGSIRNDGKLAVAGDASGLVQVFDVNSRAILRSLHGHQDAVRYTAFLPNRVHILTASDDRSVRVWDMTSETEICKFYEHSDYVRTGAVSRENPNIILSGSYDNTVQMYDIRANKKVMTMEHGFPVEAVNFFVNDGLIASAGSNQLKIWDVVAGGRCLQTVSNHQKTITCMTLDGSGTRLLTGSLDQHVKIYDVVDFKVAHSIKYPAPILSIGVSPNDTHLVVGMSNGNMSIRERKIHSDDVNLKEVQEIKKSTYQYFMRGVKDAPLENDLVVAEQKRTKMAKYDVLLKQFSYGKALDEVLVERNLNAVVVISVLEELVDRDGLVIALSGRDDVELEPIAKFVLKYVDNPRSAKILVQVTNVLLDMYGPLIATSTLIDETFVKIKAKITNEIQTQKRLMDTLGMLEAIFAASN